MFKSDVTSPARRGTTGQTGMLLRDHASSLSPQSIMRIFHDAHSRACSRATILRKSRHIVHSKKEALQPIASAAAQGKGISVQCNPLEGVLQFELDMTLCGPGGGDLTEVGVRNPIVRITVAGYVEGVEEVSAEVELIFLVDGEVFLHSHIDVEEARSAKRSRPNIAKVKL